MSDIVDISYWQGLPYSVSPNDSGIDYDKLAAKSPGGAILRASSGSYKDLRFEQNYAELHARGVPLAAYHFFKPVVDVFTQADVFVSATHNKVLAFPHYTRVLDVEAPASGWGKLFYAVQVETMMKQMGGDAIYTRASFWNDNVLASAANSYPLWVAHYGTDTPAIPSGWDDYTLHQYSADGNGKGAEYGVLSSAIDLNRLNPALVTDPPPDPQPAPGARFPFEAICTASWRIGFRHTPALPLFATNRFGYIYGGTVVTVYAETTGDGYTWWLCRDQADRVGWAASDWLQEVE